MNNNKMGVVLTLSSGNACHAQPISRTGSKDTSKEASSGDYGGFGHSRNMEMGRSDGIPQVS